MNTIALCDLKPGHSGILCALPPRASFSRRLESLGFTKGAHVTCLQTAKSGDPSAFWVRDTAVALRRCDAEHITVSVSNA